MIKKDLLISFFILIIVLLIVSVMILSIKNSTQSPISTISIFKTY